MLWQKNFYICKLRHSFIFLTPYSTVRKEILDSIGQKCLTLSQALEKKETCKLFNYNEATGTLKSSTAMGC